VSSETLENQAGKLYLGIDPGREKCGIALLDEAFDSTILLTCEISQLTENVNEALAGRSPEVIFIGDGTGHSEVKAAVQAAFEGIRLEFVDERHSTEKARELYFRDHPPRGILRFIPRGLISPGKMIDAYAALVIVFRGLSAINKDGNGV